MLGVLDGQHRFATVGFRDVFLQGCKAGVTVDRVCRALRAKEAPR
jgi:hypothetical protein